MSASNVVHMPTNGLTPSHLVELALKHYFDKWLDAALATRAPQVSTLPTPESLRMASRTLNGAVWTPELLAGRLKTCASTIQRIERGQFKSQRAQTWAMVDRMASALGVPQEQYRMAVLRMRNDWLAGEHK
jgi:hypothetical protein